MFTCNEFIKILYTYAVLLYAVGWFVDVLYSVLKYLILLSRISLFSV